MLSSTRVLVPLLLILPTAVDAQASVDSVVAHLKPGQHVRVQASGGPRLEGQLVAVATAPPVLQITVGDTVQSVRVADSIWVRGSNTMTGLFMGALAGGVVGAVVWSDSFEDEGLPSQGPVALAGAAAGALLGAAIGSGIHSWRLRYPRSPTRVGFVPLHGARLGVAILLRSPTRGR